MTVPDRRVAVEIARMDHGMSERKACEVFHISRNGNRYEPRPREDESELRDRIKKLVEANPRYGYRRIHALLRREGILVNIKRVHRIYREEGMMLRPKRPKRRQYAPKGEVKRKSEYPNHVWTVDIIFDRLANGRQFKILNIVDEFTREALLMRVGARIDSMDVIESLKMLMESRGEPVHLRSDNGSEFIAGAVKKFIEKTDCSSVYIDPGSPWQNPYIESFHGKLRDECLNMNIFLNGNHVKSVVSDWMDEYNNFRPHSSLGYKTPREFAIRYESSLRATPSGSTHTELLENPKLRLVQKLGA